TEVAGTLRAIVGDVKQPAASRVEALKGLAALKDSQFEVIAKSALTADAPLVRAEARRTLALAHPAEAMAMLSAVLENGSISEQQSAFAVLGDLKTDAADAVLARWLDRLNSGKVPLEIRLDLLDAVGKRRNDELSRRLATFEKSRPATDPLANFRE